MTGGTPAVSVIIVNWNGAEFLPACFRSLADQTFKGFEVVFVDNASADGSAPLARRLASELDLPVTVVELPVNTGFTGGNIEGLKHCSGKYIALLNNDTEADPIWLRSLAQAMDTHPDVGICASKVLVAGTDTIDSAGEVLWTNLRTARRGLGLPSASYAATEYVFGATGAAALYRRRMLDDVGFLDDDFFLYYEDSDLNFRAQLAGWKCLFLPDAVVHHKVNATTVRIWDIAQTKILKNDKILIVKNAPALLLLKHLPLYIAEELVFSLYYHVQAGRFRAYLAGLVQFFSELPRHLEKRRRVMATRNVTTEYLESIMTPIAPHYKDKFRNRMKRLLKTRKSEAS